MIDITIIKGLLFDLDLSKVQPVDTEPLLVPASPTTPNCTKFFEDQPK